MLHGLAQVNIAPLRKAFVQYAETDRPLSARLIWCVRLVRERSSRIHVTMERHATSRTRMGKFNRGTQKCLQIPAP